MVKKYALLLGNILLYIGTLFIVMNVHNLLFLGTDYLEFHKRNITLYTSMMFTISTLCYVLIFRIKAKRQKDPSISLVNTLQVKKLSGSNVLLLVGMGIAGCLFSIGLIDIDLTGQMFPSLLQMVKDFSRSDVFLFVLIGGGMIMPSFEEILFRGIIFNELRKHVPVVGAVLLQAFGYALLQPSTIISVISFFSGIIYCIIYLRIGSILAPITVQITAMSLLYLTHELGMYEVFYSFGQPVLYVMTIASLVFLLGGTYHIWKQGRTDKTSDSQIKSI
ncbi:CPBP family intramembrane glutamic endopeptidase [Brevibacillus dissolubilis]|uniref:CPBP family intramembrane glutamic endopeptidase n=1 Tax=Brevibacillus dissolubilis TaxID=1844116 RepID=UPI00111798A6|nr:CPBP family intramembrane glutamic endopeptidase [Brevibacillus dissolubilis]